MYTNAENGSLGRLLFPGFSGVRWRVRSDHDSYVQPFVQTAPNWTFYEPIPGGNTIAGNLEWQWSTIEFDNAQNYSGVLPNTVVHLDGNGQIRDNSIGLQFGGPAGLVPGQEVRGHVSIFDWGSEPEPGSATLVMLGAPGLLGCAQATAVSGRARGGEAWVASRTLDRSAKLFPPAETSSAMAPVRLIWALGFGAR